MASATSGARCSARSARRSPAAIAAWSIGRGSETSLHQRWRGAQQSGGVTADRQEADAQQKGTAVPGDRCVYEHVVLLERRDLQRDMRTKFHLSTRFSL